MPNIVENGLLAKAFPANTYTLLPNRLSLKLFLQSDGKSEKDRPNRRFEKAGIVVGDQVITYKFDAHFKGKQATLSDILQNEMDVPEAFYIKGADIEKWRRKRQRIPENAYSENSTKSRGSRIFPDPINRPSRTITTGEGERWPAWNTHVIPAANGRYRRLTPIELERLNMFPDEFTSEANDAQRGFLMGNALVIGIIEKIGKVLAKRHFDK